MEYYNLPKGKEELELIRFNGYAVIKHKNNRYHRQRNCCVMRVKVESFDPNTRDLQYRLSRRNMMKAIKYY